MFILGVTCGNPPISRNAISKTVHPMKLRLKAKTVIRKCRKFLYHRIGSSPNGRQAKAFILGCQRSGTTLLLNVFDADTQCYAYPEWSELCVEGDMRRTLRWRPLDELKQMVARNPAPLVVMKPIVESQRANEILDVFPDAHAIWMFRHFSDVARSNVLQFNARLNDLGPLVRNDPSDWRSSHASDEVRSFIRQFYEDDLTDNEAAALFWYARNQLYFDQTLNQHPRIRLLQYENLVAAPRFWLQQVYDFIGAVYPNDGVEQIPHRASVGKGKDCQIRRPITGACQEFFEKLRSLADVQWSDQATQKFPAGQNESV
ncbi:MAG TPA: hypothetical protein DDZ51_17570 [Planctomycetaceae bacterium]|nr:hypothetical protein [Planctomycetaceae bacterium]